MMEVWIACEKSIEWYGCIQVKTRHVAQYDCLTNIWVYSRLLPQKQRKPNFYLDKYTPAQWYGSQVVGLNSIKKVVSDISEQANIDRFFTNHSLFCTSATRLFRSGVDRTLIKEFTGHLSDAIDNYQVTSDQQRENISKVIGGEVNETVISCKESELKVVMKETNQLTPMSCECNKTHFKITESDELGSMISSIVKARGSGKVKIKIEIGFGD